MITARLSNWGSNPRTRCIIQSLLVLIFVVGTFSLFYFPSLGNMNQVHANNSGKLPGHVPGLVKTSQLLGPTDPNTSVSLVVGLHLRNQAYLPGVINNSSTYFSPIQRALTSQQFAETYAPLQTSQDAVIAYLQQAGFKVTRTYNNRLLIDVKGTVGMAEKAFQLQINNYRSPGGRQFYAPTTDPTVPTSLAPIIQSIVGLDNATFFTHSPIFSTNSSHIVTRTSNHALVNTSNIICTPPGCTCPAQGFGYFLPNQLAIAFNLQGLYSAGYYGQNQTAGLLELDDYVPTDISTYAACYNASSVAIKKITVDGGTGTSPGSQATKVEADMELILSTAPKLTSLKVYEAPNTTTGWIDAWGQIINTDKVPVVSTGWGHCESNTFAQAVFQQENTLFMTAAAQNETIFAASGDLGSNGCGNPTPTTPSVDDPASQPYVTGVGGTTISLNAKNHHISEKVWSHDNTHTSGGGISSLWPMPSWQQGPGVTNTGSGTPCGASAGNYCREVPDVSFSADNTNGYPIYCTVAAAGCSSSSPWTVIGGTSAAASMWAGMIALANVKLVTDPNNVNHLIGLGFLNPLLYMVNGNASMYSNDFYDIQSGTNNTTGVTGNGYQATAYYDMASGLGSYKALTLANDLENFALQRSTTTTPTITPPTTTTVTPIATTPTTSGPSPVSTTWYFAEGKVGGGFTEYITIENPDPVNDCSVSLQYLLGSGTNPAPKTLSVPHASRFTESVNSDLGTPSNLLSYQTVSTIVTVNPGTNCKGVVAERPMYFTNFQGVSSGSDVLGATHPGKSFYFADIPTKSGENSFITILNPPGNSQANVTATYYDGGSQPCNTQALVVQPGTRGTIIPGTATQASCPQGTIAKVTSDQSVVIERPAYFSNIPAGNAGTVSGAASVVGAPNPAQDWLFAEGYTGGQFQEFLKLANYSSSSTPATVTLEYSNGHTQKIQVTVPGNAQTVVNVNAYNATPTGTCDVNPCQPTQDVSADVSSTPNNIVVEREMFFHYSHGLAATGVTDVTGEVAPAASAYSFAEGYTNTGYDEWLTLQNPTANSETIKVTLVNEYGQFYTQTYQVTAHSRSTILITSLVLQNLVHPGGGYQDYEVSMTVQSTNQPFVAERPMYWNTGSTGTQGGSDVIGYIGG